MIRFVFASHLAYKPELKLKRTIIPFACFQRSISNRLEEREINSRSAAPSSWLRMGDQESTLTLSVHTKRSNEKGWQLIVICHLNGPWFGESELLANLAKVRKCTRISRTSSFCNSLCSDMLRILRGIISEISWKCRDPPVWLGRRFTPWYYPGSKFIVPVPGSAMLSSY